ncbi:MAG: DUF881 domain-containing protein [Nocardioides sp.]|nr:DUF881 domain-containing protein [Nocardioides sp.]
MAEPRKSAGPGAHLPRRARWVARLRTAWSQRRENREHRSWGWRAGVSGVFAAVGVLVVTSAISSDGTDLRAERYGDLESLARQQNRQVQNLQERVTALTTEVETLTEGVDDSRLDELEEVVDLLRGPAGLEEVAGSGVTVTLDDAPSSARELIDGEMVQANDLVVHQQDIQAVVNALWAGGAEAMTVQGQRVISTTGIKCVGNTVILHGVPYAPPYRISAIGDPGTMAASLSTNDYIATYRDYVDQLGLVYTFGVDPMLEMPAFEGSVALDYARSAGAADIAVLDNDL